ncbi:RibD family protein [Rhizobium sp. GN54]|uniref:RibD family protein n=1 Tax=Rhizobium sp. GN54 TaxID=2898150 RepID=UPI001E55E3E2|nr:RibD family protein [Rhizobium sp. GN54]MCD2184654.1 RibD family protein [Rhizobium sp. GN54]
MNDTIWSRLLALRQGAGEVAMTGAAYRLYGPIAGARGRFVLAQVGQSLDGRIATPAGDARDVSGRGGLTHLHRCRALVDAVIVGVNTVRADDPKLSVRMVKGLSPVRVIVDCHAELDGSESLFHDGGASIIVFRSVNSRRQPLPGAEIIDLVPKACGLDPEDILDVLTERKLNRVLVEGGARTIARFVEAGLVDRLHVAISPIIIGSGPSGISLSPIERLTGAHRPPTEVYNLGSDILFDCLLRLECTSDRKGQDIGVANQV